jgi:hypothetical protein
MTTEEFLTAAATDVHFDRQHTPALQTFMTACDLVKYARQIPHVAEADEVLKAAAGFVEKTREDREDAETQRRKSDETREDARSATAA